MEQVFYSGAIGLVEARGCAAAAAAADVMLRVPGERPGGSVRPGGGLVTVVIRGDPAAVRTAVDQGARCAERLGRLTGAYVIAKPSAALAELLSGEFRQ